MPRVPNSSGSLTQETRCPCGNLLARRLLSGAEVKCRRCKRQVMIPVSKQSALSDEIRCRCGNLLALRLPTGLALKCRRCKRQVEHTFDENDEFVKSDDC